MRPRENGAPRPGQALGTGEAVEVGNLGAKSATHCGSRHRGKPLPKPCPSCAFMKPAKVHACPKCGFAPERQSDVEVGEGDLVPVAKSRKPAPGEKQAVYSQLLAIAMARRYSDGWVAHKYREFFGVWPRGLVSACAEPTREVLSFVRSSAVRFAKTQKAEVRNVA